MSTSGNKHSLNLAEAMRNPTVCVTFALHVGFVSCRHGVTTFLAVGLLEGNIPNKWSTVVVV